MNDENKSNLTELISKLEIQKSILDSQTNTYKHSGYQPRDITENISISHNTNFYARISLNEINQSFIIYFKVVASDNNKYWIGYGGNIRNNPGKSKSEFTKHQFYSTKEIHIQENIIFAFNLGFKELNVNLKTVECVRLRASDKNKNEISFEYKFI